MWKIRLLEKRSLGKWEVREFEGLVICIFKFLKIKKGVVM